MLVEEILFCPGFLCEYGETRPWESPSLDFSKKTDYIDFGFCLSGKIYVTLEGIDGTFVTKGGGGNIVHGGNLDVEHRIVPGEVFSWLNLRLDSRFLEETLGIEKSKLLASVDLYKSRKGDELHYFKNDLSQPIRRCISDIRSADRTSPHGRLFAYAKCLELLSHHLADFGDFRSAIQESEDLDFKIRQARDILIRNHRDPPSLKELAKLSGLNETYLKQEFRRVFGTSVFRYLRSYRMEKAREYLERGCMTVADAGWAVGYSSYSRFSSAFKNYHGLSPGYFSSGRTAKCPLGHKK